MRARTHKGFTIVELLIVVSIIALLIGILLPAIGQARETALMTQSMSNLRQIGTAHQTYGAEWNDNQWTMVPHNLATYGGSANGALSGYCDSLGDLAQEAGICPDWLPTNAPAVYLGYGTGHDGLTYLHAYPGTPYYLLPIDFDAPTFGFGTFRMSNIRSFNRYLNGRFYDPVFYAPKDRAVISAIGDCWDEPNEFCWGDTNFSYWSSYALSPAALMNPEVWGREDGEFPGSTDAFFGAAGGPASFRVPTFSQARHASLKTHMIEHHWLQGVPADCNPNVETTQIPGSYDGCIPYYFNHSVDSNPVALYYDGSVDNLSVMDALVSDSRAANNHPDNMGLWRRDTPMGEFGYFSEFGVPHYGQPLRTGYHVLTYRGIQGRDRLGR